MSTEANHHHIHYIEFTASDLPAIKAFYGQVFGWTFQDWDPEYIAFSNAGIEGGFRQGEPTRGAGPLVILYATGLEATETLVRAAGAPITTEIFAFPGGRRFHFTDPAGNELAVWGN
jgi:predicted enzyme related to lactoylglutathione lyase